MDVASEEVILVTERIGQMRVESRSGRLTTVPAARGELIHVDGKRAIVKFGKREVRVRILGDWQLQGFREPQLEAEPAA